LKSLVLDNLTQDSSGVHETVAMKVFARLGIPAPREAHARVYVNNVYAGVYAVVESIDKDFLARIFGSINGNVQNDGYLFEYEYVEPWTFTYLGDDYREYISRFNAQTRENSSDVDKYEPIAQLVRLVNETYPELYLDRLSEYIDLRAFMRFVAAQNFVAEKDGFLGYAGMNNFYLYRLEDRSQHVFIAWDNDNSFRSVDWPILAGVEDNVLTANAIRVTELREAYVNALKEAVADSEELASGGLSAWLERETLRQLDLIRDALREDPVRPYTYEDHLGAREEMLTFARERTRFVREELARLGFGDVSAAPLRK
jgi:spore coat protein CotH